MRSPNDYTGNQTRDLIDCSAVPQPIAPPRTVRFSAKPILWSSGSPTQLSFFSQGITLIKFVRNLAMRSGTPCNIMLQSSYKFIFDFIPIICQPRLWWRNKTYSYQGEPSVLLFCPGVVADNIPCISTIMQIIQSYLTEYIIICTSTVTH